MFLPRENIVYFEPNLLLLSMKEMIAAMPNLKALYLIQTLLEDRFL